MSDIPVFLFGFSNDAQQFLPALHQESYNVWRILRELENFQLVRLFREESLTNAELVDYLNFYRDQITILHFAGHGNNRTLVTEEDATDPKGIGALVAGFPNLKLVVLNACSTGAQAELFLRAGVPAVVATTLKVQDKQAQRFSELFYAKLAFGDPISDAFRTAAAGIASIQRFGLGDFAEVPEQVYDRGLLLSDESSDGPPWQLFINQETPDIHQQWRLLPWVEEEGAMDISRLIRLMGSTLQPLSAFIKEHNRAQAQKLARYLDAAIILLEKKIDVIARGGDASELQYLMMDRAGLAREIEGEMTFIEDPILLDIAKRVHNQLVKIIGQNTMFILQSAELQEKERDEMVRHLEKANFYYRQTRHLLTSG